MLAIICVAHRGLRNHGRGLIGPSIGLRNHFGIGLLGGGATEPKLEVVASQGHSSESVHLYRRDQMVVGNPRISIHLPHGRSEGALRD